MTIHKRLSIFLLLVLFAQACNMQVKSDAAATPTLQKTATPTRTKVPPTLTQMVTATMVIIPSMTPAPVVTITAVKGNLFIRRGPDMAYNPIDVLYKGTTANVVARDVLSKWVQIAIPNSKKTGWVSLMTEYSQVAGDVGALPEFKVTDWPIAGYVRNCMYHRMFLEPGDIYVESRYREPENLVWINPGHYIVYDVDMPDVMQIGELDMREGIVVDITEDGTGERRKCPK
jgi:hypothetical protein